jgi:hypothetical protein
MFLAIAVESKQHPRNQHDYRVWYLEIDDCGQVVGVGAKSKQEVIENLFENYRKTGKSNWRAFPKGADERAREHPLRKSSDTGGVSDRARHAPNKARIQIDCLMKSSSQSFIRPFPRSWFTPAPFFGSTCSRSFLPSSCGGSFGR